MVDDVMAHDRIIGMIQTRPGGERVRPRLVGVGCAGRITSYAETSDGRYLITLTGVCRFRAGEELSISTPYRQVKAGYDAFESDLDTGAEAVTVVDRERFARALKRYLNRRDLDIDWRTVEEAPLESLATGLAMGLPFDRGEKQALLEAADIAARFETLITLLEIDSVGDGDDEPPSMQ
jgi:Lon protease-like protein